MPTRDADDLLLEKLTELERVLDSLEGRTEASRCLVSTTRLESASQWAVLQGCALVTMLAGCSAESNAFASRIRRVHIADPGERRCISPERQHSIMHTGIVGSHGCIQLHNLAYARSRLRAAARS